MANCTVIITIKIRIFVRVDRLYTEKKFREHNSTKGFQVIQLGVANSQIGELSTEYFTTN